MAVPRSSSGEQAFRTCSANRYPSVQMASRRSNSRDASSSRDWMADSWTRLAAQRWLSERCLDSACMTILGQSSAHAALIEASNSAAASRSTSHTPFSAISQAPRDSLTIAELTYHSRSRVESICWASAAVARFVLCRQLSPSNSISLPHRAQIACRWP